MARGLIRRRGAVKATAFVLVAPDADLVRPLVGPLLANLIADGIAIHGFGPKPSPDTASWLFGQGVEWHDAAIAGGGFEPTAQVRNLAALSKVIRRIAPSSVMGLGCNGAVLAGLAGRLAGVSRIVALIDSLPPELLGEPHALRDRIRRETTRRLVGVGLRRSHAALFLREGDPDSLSRIGLLPNSLEVHLARGVQIDVENIAERPLPSIAGGLTFLAAGPLVAGQGIREYCLAALALSEHGVRANWHLLATEGRGPDAIDPAQLPGLGEAVTLIPPATPLVEAIAAAHIFVVPAVADQTPEVAVHALAVGRPLIVTDVPAHRALVDEPVNGVYVTGGDVAALGDGMAYCLRRPDLVASMSRASRLKAERLFTTRSATLAVRNILELPGPQITGRLPVSPVLPRGPEEKSRAEVAAAGATPRARSERR